MKSKGWLPLILNVITQDLSRPNIYKHKYLIFFQNKSAKNKAKIRPSLNIQINCVWNHPSFNTSVYLKESTIKGFEVNVSFDNAFCH